MNTYIGAMHIIHNDDINNIVELSIAFRRFQ